MCFVGEINGYKCKHINALCNELKNAFHWPDDKSCVDAMFHLDWIREENYKIIVNKFRIIKDNKQKDLIIKELESYQKFWNDDNERFIVEYR